MAGYPHRDTSAPIRHQLDVGAGLQTDGGNRHAGLKETKVGVTH